MPPQILQERRPSSRRRRRQSSRRQKAEINDEFAKPMGLESRDQLKEAARERLASEFAGATRQRVKRALLDRLDESHDFEAPPSLVDEEFKVMWNSVKAEMESSGKTLPTRTRRKRRPRRNTARSPIAESGSASCCPRSAGSTRSRCPTMRSPRGHRRASSMAGREKEVWDCCAQRRTRRPASCADL